jgi:hypothetical protein
MGNRNLKEMAILIRHFLLCKYDKNLSKIGPEHKTVNIYNQTFVEH